eukprot:6606310-Pyramimonas_sp.AAC.1
MATHASWSARWISERRLATRKSTSMREESFDQYYLPWKVMHERPGCMDARASGKRLAILIAFF